MTWPTGPVLLIDPEDVYDATGRFIPLGFGGPVRYPKRAVFHIPNFLDRILFEPPDFPKGPNTTEVTGQIRDVNDAPVGRVVYVIQRPLRGQTPKVLDVTLSDPVTGIYTAKIPPNSGEISRVVVSANNAAPLLNDLIDRVVT